MPLESKVRQQMLAALKVVDDRGLTGPRLADDAQRLWRQLQKLLALHLVAEPDEPALELACFALQLWPHKARSRAGGKAARMTLRDRTEQSAELLVETLRGKIDDELLDRAARLLHETPQRQPVLEDARLLADTINLDDFGVVGLLAQFAQHQRQGEGVRQLVEGAEKREQYGYWEARLKDGFHFEPIRRLARERLASARQVVKLLGGELNLDVE